MLNDLPWDYDHQFRPPEYDEKIYRCPVCGKACDYIYRAKDEIVGCDNCIERFNAENVLDGE